MEPSYHILYKEGQGEVVEKKSRFIANIFPVNTEEEALERIGQIKKKHYDARHNCFAYVIGEKMRSCAAVMTENRRERQDGRCWKY